VLIASRIRKVKCDEEKPHCKRCTSTGRACDGYDVNFRPASQTHPNSPPLSGGYQVVRSQSPIPLAPALRLKTAEERNSFEFFTTHAVYSLRGFLDSPFWQREILQAAHHHESIQHCIVALGAMHRRFYEGTNSHLDETAIADQYLQFALRKSNDAIHGLVKGNGPGGGMAGADRVTLMACSVIFSSMACLQGHQKEGIQHLRSGIRLLNELDREGEDKVERHPIHLDSLRSIIVGLDLQARSIMTSRDAQDWEPLPRTKSSTVLQKELGSSSLDAMYLQMQGLDMSHGSIMTTQDASAFHSLPGTKSSTLSDSKLVVDHSTLVAMHLHLQTLTNEVIAFLQSTLNRVPDQLAYRRLLSRFDACTDLLSHLCARAAHSVDDFSQPLMALQLLHTQVEYYLCYPRGDVGEKFYFMADPHRAPFEPVAHFARMLDLATRLLPHSSSLLPVFTTSMGPLAALWIIATRAPSVCTEIRKRAVRVMLSYPRREGFWDGMVAGQIAQEVLKLEQESAQEELGLWDVPSRDLIVPDDLRIVVVALKYDEGDNRKASVEHRSARDMALGRRGRMQYLTW
jgi:hypothetical protein